MAVDQFLKIDGIDGESKDAAHTGEIDVLAWSWGMSQSGSMHAGGGGGAGKVSVQDLSITKYVDKASANLMQYCCSGKHIPQAILTIRKAGEEALEYLIITMDELLITSVSTGGSGGEDKLTENVSLNFAKVSYSYIPQTAEGSGDGAIEFGWDIQGNAKL